MRVSAFLLAAAAVGVDARWALFDAAPQPARRDLAVEQPQVTPSPASGPSWTTVHAVAQTGAPEVKHALAKRQYTGGGECPSEVVQFITQYITDFTTVTQTTTDMGNTRTVTQPAQTVTISMAQGTTCPAPSTSTTVIMQTQTIVQGAATCPTAVTQMMQSVMMFTVTATSTTTQTVSPANSIVVMTQTVVSVPPSCPSVVTSVMNSMLMHFVTETDTTTATATSTVFASSCPLVGQSVLMHFVTSTVTSTVTSVSVPATCPSVVTQVVESVLMHMQTSYAMTTTAISTVTQMAMVTASTCPPAVTSFIAAPLSNMATSKNAVLPTCEDKALSTGQKAGIGAGIGVGSLVLLSAGALLGHFLKRPHRHARGNPVQKHDLCGTRHRINDECPALSDHPAVTGQPPMGQSEQGPGAHAPLLGNTGYEGAQGRPDLG